MSKSIEYSNNKIQYHLSKIDYHAKKIGIGNVDEGSRINAIRILELYGFYLYEDDKGDLYPVIDDSNRPPTGHPWADPVDDEEVAEEVETDEPELEQTDVALLDSVDTPLDIVGTLKEL